MVGEVTIICMDTSKWMTGENLIPWFVNQCEAIELYCKRKLKAHPDNHVGIVLSGERDLGHLLLPTNNFKDVKDILESFFDPIYQDINLLNALSLCKCAWSGEDYDHLNKRIVVFAGGPPFYFAKRHLKPVVEMFKEEKGVVIDVVDFFHVLKKYKARKLRMLVDCMNKQNNDVNRVGQYLRVPDNEETISISHYLSNSSILPPRSCSPSRKKKQKKQHIHSAQIRKKKQKKHHIHSGQIRKKKQKKHPIVIC